MARTDLRTSTGVRQAPSIMGLLVDWVISAALLAVALPIAFYGLGNQSLWLDEGTTQAYVTSRHIGTLLIDLVRPSQGYPLYHVLLKITTRLMGDSEWALRAPSAVAGGLAVPALYALGVELRGRLTGLAAAALLVLAPWSLGRAQEAKAYSLALLTTILLVWLFARALRSGSRRDWVLWLVVVCAAPFVHRLLLLSLLGCAASWAIFQPPARRWPALLATVIAAGLLLGAISGSISYHSASAQFADVGPLDALLFTFAQFSVGQFAGSVPLLWLAPFAVLAVLGVMRCILDLRAKPAPTATGEQNRRRGTIILLVAGGLPLVLFLILVTLQPFYEARYLVGVYPFWMLLLAWSVAPPLVPTHDMLRRATTLLVPTFALLLVIGAGVVEQRALYQPGAGIFSGAALREDYRSAVRRLAEHVHPDDLVIVHPDTVAPLYSYYAQRVAPFQLPAAHTYPQLGRAAGFGPRELDMAIRADLLRYKRAWLLVAPDHAKLADPPKADTDDDLGLVGLAFQYGEYERRIQCGEQPYAGFAGVRLYCNNMPDIEGKIPEPEIRTEATFGGQLRLRGYTVTPFGDGLHPGATLPLSLFWEPLADLADTNYLIFIHLTRPDDPTPLTQTDGPPMEGGLPTSRWTDPGALLHDDRTIPLPDDLAPGTYVLRMGVYRADDLQRLTAVTTAQTQDNAVVLGEVQITPR